VSINVASILVVQPVFYVTESWETGGEEKTLYGQVEEATVTGLRPATLYTIRLFAENELGRSKEGRVLKVFCVDHWLNMEVDLPSLFGLHVT
jgi:hypothetical protein